MKLSTSLYIEGLPEEQGLEMIRVPAGSFRMGNDQEEAPSDEQAIHRVQVDEFYIGKYPITQAQWEAVMGNNPSYFQGATRPVERVSWEDAQLFIEKLRAQTGKPYRLPTEAEWEYAARWGEPTKGYTYAGSNQLKEVGWYRDNSHQETKAVGLKYPNELGLYDLSGNVLEWCADWYSSDYYQQCQQEGLVVNPKGPDTGTFRVLRGGSWDDLARYCRCSYRYPRSPGNRNGSIGFRLVCFLQSVG